MTAAYGNRQRDVPTASADTLFNQQAWNQQTTDRHTLLDADYGRSFGGTRVTFRFSYDRFSYDGTYPFAVEPDGAPTGREHRRTRRAVERQQWRHPGTPGPPDGAGRDRVHRQRASEPDRELYRRPGPVFDIRHSSTQQAVYAQDEIKLGRWFIVNAGLRYDRYQQFVKVTPRAALIFLPSATQSFKYLYGNAFRAPNEYELNAFYFGDRVNTLRPESIDTHELVWERYINDRLRTSVSTYWYKADRLITTTVDDRRYWASPSSTRVK